MKKANKFAALAFLVLAACSTDRTAPSPEPITGETVILPCEADIPATLDFNFEGGWQVRSSVNWVSISPTSGFEGENTIEISARSDNEEIQERVSHFDIYVEGETPQIVRFYAVQRGAKGVEFTSASLSTGAEAGTVVLEMLTNDELTVSSDQDWAVPGEAEYGEAELLEDGVTASEVRTARVSIEVGENGGEDFRSASLTVSCASGGSQSIALNQGYSFASEISNWSRAFYRRSLAMRFTATWCGNCPMMAESFKLAVEENPRIVPMTIHGSSSDVYSENADDIMDTYDIEGYPTGVVNALAVVENYQTNITSGMLTGLADEAAEQLPSKTGIAAASRTSDGSLTIQCAIATKEALPYRLHVYLLEDGIVAYQSSYDSRYPGGNNYVHNYVERCSVTGAEGTQIDGEAEGIAHFIAEYDIPEDAIGNMDNAYALIFTTYESDTKFNGAVPYAIYDDFGHIIDNVVTIPLNGKTDYEYED